MRRIVLGLVLSCSIGCSGAIKERTVSEAAAGDGSGSAAGAATGGSTAVAERGKGGTAGSSLTAPGGGGFGAMPPTAGAAGAGVGGMPSSCPTAANPTPTNALSGWEYERSVDALTGLGVTHILPIRAPSSPPFDFSMVVDDATAKVLFDEAENQGKVARDGRLLPCDVQKPVDSACVSAFVDSFVGHAFRRQLTDAERGRYVNLFKAGSNNGDFAGGVELVVEATLMSPLFLYKIYWGDSTSDGTATPLTAFERASRLSYLLSGGPPDSELLDAVVHGDFAVQGGAAMQAHRLMMEPTFHDVVRRFHSQWLGLDELATRTTPGLTPELAQSMRTETESFVEDVFSRGRLLPDLLSAPVGFVDALLAPQYGVTAPATGFARVALDKSRYFGLLTQASTMAHFNNPSERGNFVQQRLMCSPLPPHPPGIDTQVVQRADQTRRDAWIQHQSSAICAACHHQIDPIGFGFENFDELGAYRDTENGMPIDSSGVLTQLGAPDRPFNGVGELSALLLQSKLVSECVTRTWLTYALQRPLIDADECAVQTANAAFIDAKLDIGEMLAALADATPFRTRDAFQLRVDTPPGPSVGSVTTLAERRKLLLDFNLGDLTLFTKIAPPADIPMFAQHATAIRDLEQQLSQSP